VDLEELAFHWMARSDSEEFSAEEKLTLDEWLQQDVRHRVAFARAAMGFERADRLMRLRPLKNASDPDESDPDLLLHVDLASVTDAPSSPHRGRRFAFASALAAVFCVLSVACWSYIEQSTGWEQYATGIGGIEQIPLPDGVSMHLNTDSAVAVRPERREVQLTRGEALIDVPKDATRPLKIFAGARELQTSGGRFDVRMRDYDDIELVVDSGRVDVRTSHSNFSFAPRTADIVSAGYVARMRTGMIHVAWIAPDDLARKTMWLEGLLSFSDETLAEAVTEFNRYNRKQIEVSDPSIAKRRIGGVFQATEPDSFVAALRTAIGVDATLVGGEKGPSYGIVKLSAANLCAGSR
jgi:transmembrane sensor